MGNSASGLPHEIPIYGTLWALLLAYALADVRAPDMITRNFAEYATTGKLLRRLEAAAVDFERSCEAPGACEGIRSLCRDEPPGLCQPRFLIAPSRSLLTSRV